MADTETLKLNPEEKRAFDEAHRTTTDFVKRISQPGSPDVPVDQLVADDDNRVLVNSPRAFTLTLDDHRRVKFHQGINSVPIMSLGIPVSAHNYVKANGATIYNSPKTVTALGGSTLPDTVRIGDENIAVQQFITAAQLTSGLTIDAWNRLRPEVRDDMVARMIKTRQDTQMPKEADLRPDPATARQDPFRDANYRPQDGNTSVDLLPKPSGNVVADQEGAGDVKASQAQQARDDKASSKPSADAQQRDTEASKAEAAKAKQK
jgi:hypothetical protein